MSKIVWIVNNTAGSVINGMVYRNYYIAKNLNEQGYDVKIISSTFNHQFITLPNDTNKLNYEIINGVDYCWVKARKYQGNGFGRILSFWDYTINLLLNKNKIKFSKPDIIIASSPMPFLGVLGYFLSKHFNSKFVFEVRDIWPLTPIEMGKMSRLHPFIIFLSLAEKFSYKKADLVVSVLSHAKPHMVSKGMKPEKFIYISNGIDIKSIETDKIELDSSITSLIKKYSFLVGFAGAHGNANALNYLIEAAQYITQYDIGIVLVGNGPEKNKLIKMAKSLDLKNVVFIEPIKKNQIDSFLELLDVCFIGLKNESVFRYGVAPSKLFDYMYAGKPIISAINAGNDIVKDSNCGLSVSPENSKEIAKSILKLYNLDKYDRDILGSNGKKYVIENFSYEKLSRKYKSYLDLLLG